MAALSEDTFSDLDQSLSETLIQKKKQAKPKKTVLKQLTVFSVESQQQDVFTAEKLNLNRNVAVLRKSLTSSQKKKSQVKISINCNISTQQFNSLQEIKENINNPVLSEALCDFEDVESRQSCVGTITNMEECKYTNSEYDLNPEEREKSENETNSSEKSTFIPVNEQAPCHSVESPEGTANTFSKEESPFAIPNVSSPNTGFIHLLTPPATNDAGVFLGLETVPANHGISFSLSSTSFIDLETPPIAQDTRFFGHSMPLTESETQLASDTELLKTPMNFSTVSVSDLGITPDMFTFKSSERPKSSLSKLRRRSTVGLRGSPETNCLIRYIAQQKSVSAEDPCDASSPYKPGRYSSLKDKISAFRASFLSLEEREQNASVNGLDNGVSHARDSNSKSPLLKQQNIPNLSAVLPSNIKKVPFDHHSPSCAEKKTVLDALIVKPAPCEVVEEASCIRSSNKAIANTLLLDPTHLKCSASEIASEDEGRESQQPEFWKSTFAMGAKVVFTKQHTPEQFDQKQLSSGPLQHGGSLANIPLSSIVLKPALKKTPKNGKENQKGPVATSPCGKIPPASDSVDMLLTKSHGTLSVEGKYHFDESKDLQQKKRVTFGRDLSPEIFDKTLPANTPLRKGKTPDRVGILSSSKLPVDALCTVQHEPIAQPNFDNVEDYDELFHGSVPFVASVDNVVSPENAGETEHTSTCVQETSEENAPSEKGRVTRSALKRKCIQVAECASLVEPSVDPSDIVQKKLQNRRNQPQPAKRKPAVKNRITKPKNVIRKVRGRKSVKKVVYGPREIVSKKPLLSPIVEIPEVLSSTPSMSPAWNLLKAEDHSESSDDGTEPVTNKKVTRKTRSVRGTDRRSTDSSEDSTCAESENDQAFESDEAGHMDDSETDRQSRSLQMAPISYEDQCVHENANAFVRKDSIEVASLMPSEMGGTLSAICSTHSDFQPKATSGISNMQELCGSAANKEKCLSTGSSISVKERPENMPIGAVSDSVLSTDESCWRRSRRLSLQVSVSSAATAHSTTESSPIKESAPSLALKRMQKLKRVSIEKSQPTNKTFGIVVPEGMSSMVPPTLDDPTLSGVDGSGYIHDNFVAAEHPTKGRSKKSSRNIRRNTIFCFHPYNILESMTEADDTASVPPLESCTDALEDCESDNSFDIEETLTNVKTSDRTVRRSMRLSRGSAITGLSWVSESATEKKTHYASKVSRRLRKSSVSASVQREYSPTPKIKVTFSSPDQETCKHVSALGVSGKSSRRKTLCTPTLQETTKIEVQKSRRRRRSFKVDGVCSVKIELEHPFDSQVKSRPDAVS